MTDDELYQRLERIFRERLGQPDLQITATTTPYDVAGWDSTAMVSIVISIEEEFGFELSPGEMRNAGSVGDLAKFVARHAV